MCFRLPHWMRENDFYNVKELDIWILPKWKRCWEITQHVLWFQDDIWLWCYQPYLAANFRDISVNKGHDLAQPLPSGLKNCPMNADLSPHHKIQQAQWPSLTCQLSPAVPGDEAFLYGPLKFSPDCPMTHILQKYAKANDRSLLASRA